MACEGAWMNSSSLGVYAASRLLSLSHMKKESYLHGYSNSPNCMQETPLRFGNSLGNSFSVADRQVYPTAKPS